MNRKFPKSDKLLEARMRPVERRVRRAERQLYRRVRSAKAPLRVWERHGGVSNLHGGVLIYTRRHEHYQPLHNTILAENYQDDWAERGTEAIAYLRLAKYEMIVADVTDRRSWVVWRLLRRARQQYRHIEVVVLVNNHGDGRRAMREGAFSYLLTPIDTDQFRLCLLSALRSRYRVCQVLERGIRCDKSCKNNFIYSDREGYIPGEMDVGY